MEKKSTYLTQTSKEIANIENNEKLVEYTLTNPQTDFSFSFLNLGGIITHLRLKNQKNDPLDVILGYQDKTEYLKNPIYFNAIVGRVCGRISHAKFSLNDKEYQLSANNGGHHLHGGNKGFSHKIWEVSFTEEGARLSYSSPHLEEGYPGNVEIQVEYKILKDEPGYKTEIRAQTDQTTLVNINTHEYFDLSGGKTKDVFQDHNLLLNSRLFVEMGEECLPTGHLKDTSDHPAFDFSSRRNIRENRNTPDSQWDSLVGFDTSYVLGKFTGDNSLVPASFSLDKLDPKTKLDIPFAGTLSSTSSGLAMDMYTNQEAIHFYGGDYLCPDLIGVSLLGKQGKIYSRNDAICLECQGLPNSINQKGFPSIALKPGQNYSRDILHVFRNL